MLVDCECVALRRSYKLLFCYRRLRAKNELFFFLGLYCNIEEVLSCRFIWGNSNVSIFSFSLIYTLRKGILAFLLPGAIYFSIFLFLMEDNKNNETEQVTEQVKANAKPSASEKKDAKDKEVVMVCEYIEKGDYYIYYPEQCMAQNDNNLVFLSENGIKIEAFFQ